MEPSPRQVNGRWSGNYRWVICALLLFGVTKNYMDRQVLGVLKTTLQHDLGWNEIEYSNLVSAFQAAYAIGMLAVGWLVDRVGARAGYAIAMVFWSLASMGHAIGSSLGSFVVARSALGFWEAGVFPASIKAVADWFPKEERALATGIFNAGTSAGAMATPLMVPWITIHWGWRWAFLITGALGVVWLVFWLLLYRKPEEEPRVSNQELEYIRSGSEPPGESIQWRTLLPLRQTWAFAIGKFMLDPIWWFYLFWVPDFLQRRHGLALMKIGLPVMLIYLISDIGSIGGGWLSSTMIHRGISVNFARKFAMLICSLMCCSHRFRISRPELVGCRFSDWPGGCGTSGLFRQFVYDELRPLPDASGGVRGRYRRHGRRNRRHAHRQGSRVHSPEKRQLSDSFPDRRLVISGRVGHHSLADPSP